MPKPTEPKCPKRIRCLAWHDMAVGWTVIDILQTSNAANGAFLPDAELAALEADAAAWRKHKRAKKKAKKKGAKR